MYHRERERERERGRGREREREKEKERERDLPHMWIDCVILVFPGHGSIDALTIDMEPTSKLIQSLFIYGLDCAVWCWSNINQSIASVTLAKMIQVLTISKINLS